MAFILRRITTTSSKEETLGSILDSHSRGEIAPAVEAEVLMDPEALKVVSHLFVDESTINLASRGIIAHHTITKKTETAKSHLAELTAKSESLLQTRAKMRSQTTKKDLKSRSATTCPATTTRQPAPTTRASKSRLATCQSSLKQTS
jgi:hypothetical protein